MFERIMAKGLKLDRPPVQYGRYRMIIHEGRTSNPERFKVLNTVTKGFLNDGLSSLNYTLVNTALYNGFTHFLFDIGEVQ